MEFPIRCRAPISEGPAVTVLAIGLESIDRDGARDPRRRCTRWRARRGGARLPLRPLRRRAAPAGPRRCWRIVEPLRIPSELEVRPAPPRRARPVPAARLVVGIALVVVVGGGPGVALCAALCAALVTGGVALLGWLRSYVRREFIQQWRFAAWVCPPIVVFWAWMWWTH